MEAKKSVKVNKYGQALLASEDLRELLLHGKHIGHLIVGKDEDIELYKKYQSELLSETTVFLDPPAEDLSFDEFHEKNSNEWIIPVVYQQINVKKWLLDKCKTSVEKDRVEEEYKEYESRDLVMLLRLIIYLVDYMRKNKILWGVGRGSSCSSYILFLIGIHRVDSIKYNLSISEFLR